MGHAQALQGPIDGGHGDPPRGLRIVAQPRLVELDDVRAGALERARLGVDSGGEIYMRDLAEAAKAGPLTPTVIGPIASRYDFQAVPIGN